ncbi:MAG: choice-of-anchor J domain-containing protein [Chitinophagales bacterium]
METSATSIKSFQNPFKTVLTFVNICLLLLTAFPSKVAAQETSLLNPIIFCTQVPQPDDFLTLMSTFGNHIGSVQSAPRGGDLWIWYPDGTLKNLTQTAGYGNAGDGFGNAFQQGATSIAVRDPHVHWDGEKALFSMVMGHATQRYVWETYYWQIYEITGLGKNDTPVITKVPNQPENYNNITPIYGTDDRIIFTSDRTRNGQRHLYPQHDEYESSPTVTGLWRLDPYGCENTLQLLTHAPSGDFTPMIDSYGRIVFTRWDHLQRDQQADGDAVEGTTYGTFDYSDECADATKINTTNEYFPEPRPVRTDLLQAHENGLRINVFQPWQLNEDGTELETLNHIGRHELMSYFEPSFNNDPSLGDHYTQISTNPNSIINLFHIVESPTNVGTYYGTNAGEFGTHAAGQLVKLSAPPSMAADLIQVVDLTHPDTSSPSDTPSDNHSGLYRNPLVLSDGTLIAVHTSETRYDEEEGTAPFTESRYDFRLKVLKEENGYWVADTALFAEPITKAVSFYDPDNLVQYNGDLWETFPVEVRVRIKPTATAENLPSIEANVFAAENVEVANFKSFLEKNNLALIVSRNVTSRDDADLQQPFNLKVFGSTTQTTASDFEGGDLIYDVAYFQIFQGDQVRGIGGINTPNPGRRVIAQPLHDATAIHYNPSSMGPIGSVVVADDGSIAALVPAGRSLSWQLTDEEGDAVVRERVWLSFKKGEVRVCSSCHGENSLNQAALPSPQNTPNALTDLLQHLKTVDSDGDGTVDLEDAFPYDANLTEEPSAFFSENFEGNTDDWQIVNSDADGVAWKIAVGDVCNEQVMRINNRFEENTNTSDQLIHELDLTDFSSSSLTFDIAYARFNASLYDGLKVYVVDCNGNNTVVYNKSGSDLATVTDDNSGNFVPLDCNDWRMETVDLSAFDGQMVDLMFENVGGFGNALYLDNILVQGVTPVTLRAKLWLEGVYNSSTLQMQVGDAFRSLIPLQQPFNQTPWNYNGSESLTALPSDAVDWVLVELRDANSKNQIVASRAGILLQNGLVVDVDGQTNGINFFNIEANENYFVVVRTRHHLAVMSSIATNLQNSIPYDFTLPNNVMGTNQLQLLANGNTYGLFAGDFNSDGVVNVDDFNLFTSELAGINAYSASDVNMDRGVTVADYNLYVPNASVIGIEEVRY